MSKEAIAIKALEALARLGNGDQYGNSTGNVIARTALFEMAEQPAQQEPVAWIYSQGKSKVVSMNRVPGVRATPLYTSPQAQPAREWVGLTDEDKEFIAKRASVYDWHDYEVIEASEAKLKEKNT